MLKERYFEVGLAESEKYAPTYKSFLELFVNEVESLSVYGDAIWDNLFNEIDIFTVGEAREAFEIGWIDRHKISNHRFHLQCAFLHKQGVYKDYELSRYWFPPDDFGWRKGESQTAESLISCKGNKLLISALFIHAFLRSGDRSNTRKHEDLFFEASIDSAISPRTGLYTLYQFEKIVRPLEILEKLLELHLDQYNVWRYWAQSCTSLVPIINDRRSRKHIFSSYYEFSEYLAEQFVLLSSKLCVCVYNLVPTADRMLMSRIERFVDNNRKEHQGRVEEREILNEKLKLDSIQKKEKAARHYDELCRKVLEYTDEIPSVFSKHGPLEYRWRNLDPKILESLVWSAPLTLLAEMFGKSDNGVRKWAKEVGIPLPNKGFWAKVKSRDVGYPDGSPNLKFSTG